jgi:hypothetical protein
MQAGPPAGSLHAATSTACKIVCKKIHCTFLLNSNIIRVPKLKSHRNVHLHTIANKFGSDQEMRLQQLFCEYTWEHATTVLAVHF